MDKSLITLGDSLEELDKLQENSIDSIVTDPPYELNFMGKGWDNAGISFNTEIWSKCLRVLKPGGHLLAFGGSRTFHRMACAIEDAGFEIRDTIMWLYGSGFPKSMNLGLAIDKKKGVESKVVGTGKSGSSDTHTRTMNSETKDGKSVFGGEYEIKEAQNEWQGWGTALKPAFEPIIVARKPFKGSLVDNVIKWGVGGLNIDECRINFSNNEPDKRVGKIDIQKGASKNPFATGISDYNNTTYKSNGRFPANLILTYEQMTFDEVCGGFPNTKGNENIGHNKNDDSGSASRYFYCAKASKKDRDEGLEELETKKVNDGRKKDIDNAFQRGTTLRHNTHPTVKPTELMQYLIRLVTPDNGIILDPFMGSGSTGKACMYENREHNKNYRFIGIEKEKEYYEIAKERIKNADRLE